MQLLIIAFTALIIAIANFAQAAEKPVSSDRAQYERSRYYAAKKKCLQQNSELLGKQLQTCIKKKIKKRKSS